MECYECNNNNFRLVKRRNEIDYKDVKGLEYLYECYECENCGTCIVDQQQQKNKLIFIADSYRSKKNLFTSQEIKDFRKKLDMSQDKFADYLGVGVASVRRWESAGIQDLSQNEVIRLKCDESSFIDQCIERWQNEAPNEFNGYRKFKIASVVAIFSRFNEYAASPLYFFKALFYVDALHFLKEKSSITGLRYESLEYGPIPSNYGIIRDYIKNHYAKKVNGHDIYVDQIFDEKIFADSEKIAIFYVENVLKKKGKKFIFDKVHELPAFKTSDYRDSISYELIKEINI